MIARSDHRLWSGPVPRVHEQLRQLKRIPSLVFSGRNDRLLAVLRILGSIVNIIPIPVLWIGVDRFAPFMRECQQASKQG